MNPPNPQKGIPITDQVARNITRVEELAYELKVEEVMTRDTRTFSPETSMQEVLELFREARISGAPWTPCVRAEHSPAPIAAGTAKHIDA